MDWQTRRRFLYFLATLVAVSAVSVYLLKDVIFPDAQCFDKKQNGFEAGTDCGGVCALRCTSEVIPLSVLWSNAIRTSNNTYDLVAMVSNKNINNAAHGAMYTFIVYNASGQVMKEFKGITNTPVNTDFPVTMQSVVLPYPPKAVTLQMSEGPHFTVNEKPTSPTLSVQNERYEAGLTPRVYASVSNRKRMTIRDLPVKVVLYDDSNNVYAVGETVIPELAKEETKTISFTWNFPLPSPPVRIRVYPIFDPFIPVQ